MILVTGVNGFVGKHLTREINSRGIEVMGVGNNEVEPHAEIIDILHTYRQCDITQENEVAELELQNVDCIINLAGLANVGASFSNPSLYMDINVKVLSVLGNEYLRQNPNGRIIAVSTGALYDPGQPMPLNEDSAVIKSGSPYALSKLAMEKAAADLPSKGMDCLVVRPFNHIGPGQGLGFLIPDLIQKLRSTDKKSPEITAGNIKTIRDYTDVRDIVRAYVDLATADNLSYNLYNVCSGNGHSGEDILRSICDNLDIDFSSLKIMVDETLIRPNDPPKIIGDHQRLSSDTSWQPTIDLGTTIKDILAES